MFKSRHPERRGLLPAEVTRTHEGKMATLFPLEDDSMPSSENVCPVGTRDAPKVEYFGCYRSELSPTMNPGVPMTGIPSTGVGRCAGVRGW